MDKMEFAFGPELFEMTLQLLSEEIQNHLDPRTQSSLSATESKSPKERFEKVAQLLNSKPILEDFIQNPSCSKADIVPKYTARIRAFIQDYIQSNIHLHSPQYMGHQVNPPLPPAAAFTLLNGVLNPGLAVYEMSEFATCMERALISKLGSYLGWPQGEFDGIITSGGSLANLTAILAARNHYFSQSWNQGMSESKGAILTSADSHYSIARAAGILGLGTDQVIKVPLDSRRKIDPSTLEQCYLEAKQKGLEVFCLVGSACTTPVGAFDPLDVLAEFARQKQIWFHVDGAHGAPLLLSERYRHLLKGIEKADSVIWDAHKMMFVPSLCTFVFYRNFKNSYLPFQQEAPYLFSGNSEDDTRSFQGGLRTLECTKGAIATPLWMAWTIFGPDFLSSLIEHSIDTTRDFYQTIQNSDDFIAVHEPECNIFCFRYVPERIRNKDLRFISELQIQIRNRVIQEGQFYITGTRIDEVYALRVTVVNPFTGSEHILNLLERIRTLGQEILKKS